MFSTLTLDLFAKMLNSEIPFRISTEAKARLEETREFIDFLLEKNIKVYGLTTGFADLRNVAVPSEKAAELSCNIIASHDAGIGPSLSHDVVLGAMIIRAHSLAKGFSGFQPKSLETLMGMINERIIPDIPCHGSLGASGDLALLARLGRAMQGHDVPVSYSGRQMDAKGALTMAGIAPFVPAAKEGLALTNGTSFAASMAAIALLKEIRVLENFFALLPLFLDATEAVDSAFLEPINACRGQKGQVWVAQLIRQLTKDSHYKDSEGVQDDYCIRCLPQILGPKIELIEESALWIERELNAVTDNPLIFRGEEISDDVPQSRLIEFQGINWLVISGGNFHAEYLTTAADAIALANSKIALLLERHMTYLLNPFRNKNKLPVYLLHDETKRGLHSGYMITQYTGNDLAQKIAALGVPTGIYNLTSANESEDVVSYGSTACQRLLTQITLFEDFLAIYLCIVTQSYAIKRAVKTPLPHTISEKCFQVIEEYMPPLPHLKEESFRERYKGAKELLASSRLREIIHFPLVEKLNKQTEHRSSQYVTSKSTYATIPG